jgi:cytochrome c oxidase subunit II
MNAPADQVPTSVEVAEKVETRWALFVGAITALLVGIIIFTALHWSSMPTSRVEVIDATTLHRAGEFVESNLGTGIDAQGNVTVHMLAEQYAFRPNCVVVPDGVPVTFRATSSDVVHGFQILGTNVNSMLVPGYVSTFLMTLDGPGERTMPCHEFCGVGHAAMWARVHVVPLPEFEKMASTTRRLTCG